MAFRATLEETREADVLVHVIDVSDPERRAHAREVNAVLAEIGAHEVPQLEVFNKIDRATDESARVEYDAHGRPSRVYVSAATGEGLEALRHALAAFCYPDTIEGTLCVPPTHGWLRSQLFELGLVSAEDYDSQGNALLSVTASQADLERIVAQAKLAFDDVLIERRPIRVDAEHLAEVTAD